MKLSIMQNGPLKLDTWTKMYLYIFDFFYIAVFKNNNIVYIIRISRKILRENVLLLVFCRLQLNI